MHVQHPDIAERWDRKYGGKAVPAANGNKMSAAFQAAIKRRMASNKRGNFPRKKGMPPGRALGLRKATPMASGRLVNTPKSATMPRQASAMGAATPAAGASLRSSSAKAAVQNTRKSTPFQNAIQARIASARDKARPVS